MNRKDPNYYKRCPKCQRIMGLADFCNSMYYELGKRWTENDYENAKKIWADNRFIIFCCKCHRNHSKEELLEYTIHEILSSKIKEVRQN